MENTELITLRDMAYQKYPDEDIQIKRLAVPEGIRYYLCLMRGDDVRFVLASGTNYKEMSLQL